MLTWAKGEDSTLQNADVALGSIRDKLKQEIEQSLSNEIEALESICGGGAGGLAWNADLQPDVDWDALKAFYASTLKVMNYEELCNTVAAATDVSKQLASFSSYFNQGFADEASQIDSLIKAGRVTMSTRCIFEMVLAAGAPALSKAGARNPLEKARMNIRAEISQLAKSLNREQKWQSVFPAALVVKIDQIIAMKKDIVI